MAMDPMFLATSFFRRRKFDECVEVCTKLLIKNPYDQAAWFLKTRALTEQTYVDEVEVDEEGIAEVLMDDTAIAQVARPGTSMKKPGTSQGGPSQSVRPVSSAGRPLSGFVRPGTQSGRPGTMEQAIRTPRTASTARPVTSASGRFVRLGTALFEYIFHHENDVRNALQLAALATEASEFKDWWWKVQLGKCYFRLGLYRDAERQLKSALRDQETVDAFLYLCKVYVRLDQPLTGIEVLLKGIDRFPGETMMLTGIARIYEAMADTENSVKFYKEVLQHDNTHVEAIACIGTNHFYSDQPEVALKFFRRLLQMGVYNSEIFNNIGLCCFFSQQYDMALSCFERALSMATDENMADIWYNISHIAINIGDMSLAYQCLRLSLASDNNHAEAFNNLGVLEMRKRRPDQVEQAKSFFKSAIQLSDQMYEPQYNLAHLSEKMGDVQTSFKSVEKSVEIYPEHCEGKDLLKQLKEHLASV
eukprot:gene3046-1324_t